MEACGRRSNYVNLNLEEETKAQIHPQRNGIGLVLRSKSPNQPPTRFAEIPVRALGGYRSTSNITWLNGTGNHFNVVKGPAIAFLIPGDVEELSLDSEEWRDIARLLNHAKTLGDTSADAS